MPAIRCLQNVSVHCLPESVFILLRTCDRRPVASAACEAAVFDPGLEFLVPGVGANYVNDADNELLARLFRVSIVNYGFQEFINLPRRLPTSGNSP